MRIAITATPPTTPPATAPTFGPELPDLDEVLVDEGAAVDATQIVFWHSSQVGGTREQICPEGHVGHDGVSLGQYWLTHRRNRELNGAVN